MALWKYTDEYLQAIDRWDGIMSAPSRENRKRRDGIQILENRVFERFFSTSPWWGPAIWFGPLIVGFLYLGLNQPVVTPGGTAALFLLGVLGWTLLEYILHRWVFHADPRDSYAHKRRLFMMHGYHHEFPSDRLRLVAPPALSWPIAAVVIPSYYLFSTYVLGETGYTFGLTAGTTAGYLAYDWIHYYSHHARPTTSVGKFIRRFHMEHHFMDQSTHFGLSSPLWDVVLGTFTRPSDEAGKDEVECLGTDGFGAPLRQSGPHSERRKAG